MLWGHGVTQDALGYLDDTGCTGVMGCHRMLKVQWV